MARQSTSPVSFNRSTRKDTAVLMSSGVAGVVQPVGYIPLFAGDSCAGSIGIDLKLKEMPKPLQNGCFVNMQAWFWPKSAHPSFSGRDELNHARTGQPIKSLGAADRAPPPFFIEISGAALTTAAASKFFKSLGLHIPAGETINADLIDAFVQIYNFRLAAHSSRLPKKKYASEDIAAACALPPAFWPSSRLSRVVPDYERALILGSMDLDVIAGQLPIHSVLRGADHTNPGYSNPLALTSNVTGDNTSGYDFGSEIFAEMQGQKIGVSLADYDKARTSQAFAKLRTAYAGNDSSGFDNDDTIVSLLMQGIKVEQDDFKRPWLLDSKRVPVGFAERNASDGANLDMSVTTGGASATLSLNVPVQDVGGIIMVTVELLPERVDERMSDEFLTVVDINELPNALRDIQRPEPVDLVLNRRIDAKHASPSGLYGYEPMNDRWNRDFTRLGGDFYQDTPGAGWTENRSAIWQTEIVNPTFSGTHYLAPANFPHNVFALPNADCFELVARHAVSITGLTQIGDVLAENNDDYDAIVSEGV